MKMKRYLPLLLAALPLAAPAQALRSGYVDWGTRGTDFPAALEKWQLGQKWCEDDNFFISRVKPHVRFRNAATQVNPKLDETNDKKLIYWVPVNNEKFNALPDGFFDSEVFPAWSYVTHYGDWSTTLIRLPGNFADVAHKNGVAVSVVASVPWGNISTAWYNALTKLSAVGARKLTDYMMYYGVDGIGYNSEFNCDRAVVQGLMDLHENAVRIMKPVNPLVEFIWYDGTNSSGSISFDRGLSTHNREVWGYGDNIRTSLFFNYNWNSDRLLNASTLVAEELGRSPLDLYCGINMQGREPHNANPKTWPYLLEYPLSIGLWGAHSESMLYESRAEKGSSPDRRQRSYQKRVQNWFTGGSHNPVNTSRVNNSFIYSVENNTFFGMSKFMSARSALKWDLSEEPFISYFNLGNGKFFNYKGERQHNAEWYNIGIQDYLPTWMWWFSTDFIGREVSSVPEKGLDAEYVWDDAWMGGSTLRVFGSVPDEYFHMFKTEFALRKGDVVTFRYKLVNGKATAFIAMSLKGDENKPVSQTAMRVMGGGETPAPGMWVEKTFTVGKDIIMPDGGEVAMIALHFRDAENLDLRLGEFSIKRPSALKAKVDAPVIEKSVLLSARHDGYDGKIIFNMPNNKGNQVCYNIDVNTSLFKLYAQQEGAQPVLMGMTTSWAGLMFAAPYNAEGKGRVRFGVSALALDHKTESAISWGDYQTVSPLYEMSDEIAISKSVLKPGESFTVGYVDPLHENADWTVTDAAGTTLLTAKGSRSFTADNGLAEPGIYNVIIDGIEGTENGRVAKTRSVMGYIQVTGENTGNIPEITGVDAANSISKNVADGSFTFDKTDAHLTYTAATGNAELSRGVKIGDGGLGFQARNTGLDSKKSFSISYWFKPEDFRDKSVHMLNIRYKGDPWAINQWGWCWHTLTEDGRSENFTIRTDQSQVTYKFENFRLIPGAWHHITYVFEYNEEGSILPAIYINGEKQKISSWTLGDVTTEGEPGFVGPAAAWKSTYILAIGGYLHGSGSVRGNADNLMVWDKALTPEEVKMAMGDINPDAVPENLIGLFDFESDPGKDGSFVNKGKGSFTAGVHTYEDTEVEGQGTIKWMTPDYCAGSPFLKGNGYKLTAAATWLTSGGIITENADNANGGYVKLNYPNHSLLDLFPDGFPVTLVLANEYGQDQRDLKLRFNHTGIDRVADERVNLKVVPTLFESEIGVTAPEEGQLIVSLFDLEGRRILANGFNAAQGEEMKIYPSVESGMYILAVEKNGRVLGTAKVVRR